MLLISLLVIPVIGIFIITSLSYGNTCIIHLKYNKIVTPVTSIINLFISLVIFTLFNFSSNKLQFQFVKEYIKVTKIDFYLRLDSISIFFFIVLTTIIMYILLVLIRSSISENLKSSFTQSSLFPILKGFLFIIVLIFVILLILNAIIVTSTPILLDSVHPNQMFVNLVCDMAKDVVESKRAAGVHRLSCSLSELIQTIDSVNNGRYRTITPQWVVGHFTSFANNYTGSEGFVQSFCDSLLNKVYEGGNPLRWPDLTIYSEAQPGARVYPGQRGSVILNALRNTHF